MKLREAAKNDLEELIDVRIAAFSHMPLWEYWYQDVKKHPSRLRALVRVDCLADLYERDMGESEMMVVEEESKIIAFSVWEVSVTKPTEPEGQFGKSSSIGVFKSAC